MSNAQKLYFAVLKPDHKKAQDPYSFVGPHTIEAMKEMGILLWHKEVDAKKVYNTDDINALLEEYRKGAK